MRVLVTGVAGMIGSNLAERLLHDGHRVVGIDNFWRGKRATIEMLLRKYGDSFSFIERDLRELGALTSELASIDHVYHLADVVAGINYVFANEFQVWRDNIRMNSATLEAIIDSGFSGTFTYAGTACSYPVHLTSARQSSRPLVESDVFPANPESSYGWSKLMGEYEIGLAAKEGLIQPTILRLDNVYGTPTELDPARSQFIPATIRKALLHPSEKFIVWGSGKQRRSFVHVDDVVDAFSRTLGKSFGSEAISVGPGRSTSVAEVVWEIIRISGKEIEPVFDVTRPEGDGDRFADTARAKELLGWKPNISLDIGLRDCFNKIQRQLSS